MNSQCITATNIWTVSVSLLPMYEQSKYHCYQYIQQQHFIYNIYVHCYQYIQIQIFITATNIYKSLLQEKLHNSDRRFIYDTVWGLGSIFLRRHRRPNGPSFSDASRSVFCCVCIYFLLRLYLFSVTSIDISIRYFQFQIPLYLFSVASISIFC